MEEIFAEKASTAVAVATRTVIAVILVLLIYKLEDRMPDNALHYTTIAMPSLLKPSLS